MVDLSVIIPIYKTPIALFADCLKSVLSLRRISGEIILVVDSPGEAIEDVARKCAANDARIHVLVNEKNMGVSYSRNRGIGAANGEYITFVDSDDVVNATVYEKCVAYMKDKCLDFCSMSVNGDGRLAKGSNDGEFIIGKRGDDVFLNIVKEVDMTSCGVVIRRRFLTAHPTLRYPEGIANNEDFVFITMVFHAIAIAGKLNCEAYRIVGHPDSASRKFTINQVLSKLAAAELLLNNIAFYANEPKLRKFYFQKILSAELLSDMRITEICDKQAISHVQKSVKGVIALILWQFKLDIPVVLKLVLICLHRFPMLYFNKYSFRFACRMRKLCLE